MFRSLWIAWALCALGAHAATTSDPHNAAQDAVFHRGLCVEGGPALQPRHVDEFLDLNANAISLNPFGWMEAHDEPEVQVSRTRRGGRSNRWWGEGDAGLRHYAEMAQDSGLIVMLRPHIWLRRGINRGGESVWLGDIGFDTEEDWQTFFEQYGEFALHYARLSEEAGIEWYSVGAELTRATLERPDDWRALIAMVREVYSGKLIYSGNWYREAEGIQFWDALDAIGVQAYFPLAESDDPSTDSLKAAWRDRLAPLRASSRRVDRPIIFTEIGYRSTTDAAIEPWVWRSDSPIDQELQARLYHATFESIRNMPEVQGLYWWKYYVDSGNDSRRSRRRGWWERDFTWQGKPAEEVMRRQFSRIEADAMRSGQ